MGLEELVRCGIKVIYNHKGVVILVKPSHLITMPDDSGCLTSMEGLVSRYVHGYHAAHRIDKDTTGLVIGATNDRCLFDLKRQFETRDVKKIYLAVVDGKPRDFGTIDSPLSYDKDIYKAYVDTLHGKQALTRYTLLDTFTENGHELSLLAVRIYTGRTHQIRVHLASIGFPIYADQIYNERVPGETQRLHAAVVQFLHPNDFQNGKNRILIFQSLPPWLPSDLNTGNIITLLYNGLE